MTGDMATKFTDVVSKDDTSAYEEELKTFYYKKSGRIKVLGLDGKVFREYYKERPGVYDILDAHITYSHHDADEDLFYLTFRNCALTYNTKTGYVSAHLFNKDEEDELIMNLKPENYREVVIQ